MRDAVEKLSLDLSGLVVLTEAASGNYAYTPLICAAGGCREVIALTRDSAYGRADQVAEDTVRLAREMALEGRITVITEAADEIWASADIVTNLGFVRPIGRDRVKKLKPTAAIPLMFETWEYRDEDLDLSACWESGICVLGTNEEHGAIRILDYLGPLVAKKLFEVGIEVFGSRLAVLGKGKFFFKVCSALEPMGAFVLRWLADVDEPGAEVVSGERLAALKGVDAIIAADEPNSMRCLIGSEGFVSTEEIRNRCPEAVVVQLAGVVSRSELEAAGISCLPEAPPPPGHMGWSLSELGPKPVIDLHAAGLKVGELLARGRLGGLSPAEATAEALRHPVSQDFSFEQKRLYGCPF